MYSNSVIISLLVLNCQIQYYLLLYSFSTVGQNGKLIQKSIYNNYVSLFSWAHAKLYIDFVRLKYSYVTIVMNKNLK